MTALSGPIRSPERPRSLWRQRDFMTLWGGQTLSETGSAVSTLALPLLAVTVLGASTFEVSVLQAAGMAAYLVIAVPAGAIVDRLRKRRLMVLSNTVRALAMATIPFVYFTGHLTMTQLWIVAALCSVCSVFFEVAYQCYLPMLVPKDQLLDANGKLSTTYSVSQVAGIAVGGALVSLFGAARAVLIDAVSFLVSAVSLVFVRAREPEIPRVSRGEGESLRTELGAGLAFVFGHPVMRNILAASFTLNVFSQMIYALSVVFLVRDLQLSPASVSVQLALGTAGGIAGGLASGRIARWVGTARIVWLSLLGLGWTMLLVPLARPGWTIVCYTVGMTGFAALCAIYNSAQISYRQSVCPPELLGRVTAAVRWIVWGALPVGAVIGGVVATFLGVRSTLWLAGIGVWASGLWVFFSPLRRMRDFTT